MTSLVRGGVDELAFIGGSGNDDIEFPKSIQRMSENVGKGVVGENARGQ